MLILTGHECLVGRSYNVYVLTLTVGFLYILYFKASVESRRQMEFELNKWLMHIFIIILVVLFLLFLHGQKEAIMTLKICTCILLS